MAKKKTTKQNNLRDVPLERTEDLKSLNRFSADHIIRTKYNPSTKAVVMEDIPAGLKSEFTLGESGGGGALKGKVRVKIVNSSTSPIAPYAIDQEVPSFALYRDGGIYNFPTDDSVILPNGEAYADYIFIGNSGDDDIINWYAYTDKMVISQTPVRTKTITELVNCTEDNLDQIKITDPTLEASCTIEYEDAGN